MSSDKCYPEDAPARHVKVEGFWIERYAVTNERERSYEPQCGARIPREVIKDGSSLCANYCREYRRTADMAQSMDASTCHDGLRLIVRARPESQVCSCHDLSKSQ